MWNLGSLAGDMRRRLRSRTENEPTTLTVRHQEPSIIHSVDVEATESTESLVALLLRAAANAQHISLSALTHRCADPMSAGFVEQWPGEHYRLLGGLAKAVDARRIIDVGTYTGLSALSLGHFGAHVVTYDIQGWSTFEDTALRESDFEGEIEQRIGDLSDPAFFSSQTGVLRDADLIFVDGPKDGVFEWKFADLLYSALADKSTVIVWDDTRLMNMVAFWAALTAPKLDATSLGHWSGTGLTLAS